MDNVQEVNYFNNAPQPQTFRFKKSNMLPSCRNACQWIFWTQACVERLRSIRELIRQINVTDFFLQMTIKYAA